MTLPHRARVVAVVGDAGDGFEQIGTGYLIEPRLVLTAWHCTVCRDAPVRPLTRLRTIRLTGAMAAATRVAGSATLDLALLEIEPDDPARYPATVEPLAFGRIDRDRTPEVTGCTALGFPTWNIDPRDASRSIASVIGGIRSAEGIEKGRFFLKDVELGAVFTHEPAWAGFSGALVFSGDLVLGIIVEHLPGTGTTSLEIQPIAALVDGTAQRGDADDLDALAGRLALDPDLLATARRDPISRLQERVAGLTRAQLDERFDALAADTELVESGAYEAWRAWLSRPTWRSMVEQEVGRVMEAGITPRRRRDRPDQRPRTVPDRIEPPPATATYPTIIRMLKHADLDGWLSGIPGGKEGNRFRLAAGSLHWLREQTDEPRYSYCFAVTGHWGSGKSRMVAELARRVWDTGGYVLFPDLDGPSVAASLLAAAGRLFGVQFTTLTELDDFLGSYLCSDLHVFVDRAHEYARRRPGLLEELQSLLESTTAMPRVRWVLTADEADLDAVHSTQRPAFWSEYAVDVNDLIGHSKAAGNPQHENEDGGTNLPDIAGWLDLDSCNSDQAVGLHMIRDIAGEVGNEEFAVIRRDRARFRHEYETLSRPIIGWLRACQLVADQVRPGVYADVNEASFVDQAWERRLRSIATAGLSRTTIERVIVAVARAYTELPGWPPSDERLMELLAERIPPVSMPVDEVRAAVALLERSGLLTRNRSGDSFAAPELIELREDSFWALRVAEVLHARALEDADPAARLLDSLARWRSSAGEDDVRALAILQSAVAVVARGADGDVVYPELVSRWLDQRFPVAPLLHAALAGPVERHASVVSGFRHTPPDVVTKRERFALMRFIATAEDRGFMASERFAVLQPWYESIGTDGLGSYGRYAVRAVLEMPDLLPAVEVVPLFRALAGSELGRFAGDAAYRAAWAALDAHDDDEARVVADLVDFVRTPEACEPFRRSVARAAQRRDAGETRARTRSDYDREASFWELLVTEVAERVVDRHGAHAFDRLLAWNWYGVRRAGAHPEVAGTLIREATLALGRWYQRKRWNDEQAQRYVDLVRRLAEKPPRPLSDRDARREAVYLIRHSVATRGQPRVRVDVRFHPLLRDLAWLPDARACKALRPLCEANDVPFPDQVPDRGPGGRGNGGRDRGGRDRGVQDRGGRDRGVQDRGVQDRGGRGRGGRSGGGRSGGSPRPGDRPR